MSDWSRLNQFSIPFTQSQSTKLKITCALCHELGSDGEAVGDVAFDDGDGLTSAVNGGLLAGVFGDVECRGTGCGLSGIFINYINSDLYLTVMFFLRLLFNQSTDTHKNTRTHSIQIAV